MEYQVHPPLSNIQAELLKIFSTNIPDQHLLELKDSYLMDKGRDKADDAWDRKGYTDERLHQILNK